MACTEWVLAWNFIWNIGGLGKHRSEYRLDIANTYLTVFSTRKIETAKKAIFIEHSKQKLVWVENDGFGHVLVNLPYK